jgi:hypothetical protein
MFRKKCSIYRLHVRGRVMLFLRYESCSLWKTLLWLWNVINLCLSVKWDSISWWFFLFTSMSILTNYCIIFWLYHFINRESLSPWNYFNLATYYWNAYIKPGEWAGMNAYMYVYTGNRLCLFSFFFTIFWLDVATVLTMWYFFFNFISKFMFNELRWEVIVRFAYIGAIVDHHSLFNLLFHNFLPQLTLVS